MDLDFTSNTLVFVPDTEISVNYHRILGINSNDSYQLIVIKKIKNQNKLNFFL